MRRAAFAVLLLAMTMMSMPALALDPGQAEGTMTVGGATYNLAFAYAIGRQRNDSNGRSDDIKIILTDRALPGDVDLRVIENTFPDGINGLVMSIDNDRLPSHVFVQHPGGMYDAGYFTNNDRFRFRGRAGNNSVEGHCWAKRIATNTDPISYDVNFVATVQ
jgi:hypothetical protein